MGVTDVALARAAPRPANLPTIMNNGRNIAATNSAKGVPDRCWVPRVAEAWQRSTLYCSPVLPCFFYVSLLNPLS